MAVAVGSRLGHYDVTALIGEGGMGQVYRGTDTTLEDPAARPWKRVGDRRDSERNPREPPESRTSSHRNSKQFHTVLTGWPH